MRLGFPGARGTPPKIEVPKALCFTVFELATPHFAAEWRRLAAQSTDFLLHRFIRTPLRTNIFVFLYFCKNQGSQIFLYFCMFVRYNMCCFFLYFGNTFCCTFCKFCTLYIFFCKFVLLQKYKNICTFSTFSNDIPMVFLWFS